MTEMVLIRLLYAIGLGILLAGLGFIFRPKHGFVTRLLGNRFKMALMALTALVALCWWLFAALRHWALRTAGVDLGYFANILWTTLHGNILAAAISGGSSFGWHFSPSLVLIAIPYAVWQDPLWLMGIQALITASGAIALALIAGRRGLSHAAMMLAALLWLLSPILRGAMLYDFHEIGMVAGLAAWIAYLAISGHTGWAILLALVAIGIKEDAPVYIGCLGLILAGSYKKPVAGWGIVALALIYYLSVQLFLWDMIAPNHRDYIAVRFPQVAGSGEGLWEALLGNPALLFANLWNWDRLWGILMLFLPVLFLPFHRWGGWGLLPALWLILSMSVFSPYIFSLHYAAPLFALIMIATIPGFESLLSNRAGWRNFVGYLMLGFTLSLTLAQPPLTLFSQFNPAAWQPHPSLELIRQMSAQTDSADSLTADKFMAPYFTTRMVYKEFPSNLLTDDFYLSDASMGCPQMLLLIEDLGYKNIREDYQYWFLSRKGTLDARELYLDRMKWMEAESCEIQAWNIEPDVAASQGTAMYLPAGCGWGERVVVSPGLILPPGQYEYTVRIRIDQRPGLDSNLIAEVRFVDYNGNAEEIAGITLPIDAGFTGNLYQDAKIHFQVQEWGRTYLRLNFGVITAYWLDGIGLTGLPPDFAGYYHAVFPQSLELSSICTQSRLLVPKEDGLAPSAMPVDNTLFGQVIARWQMNPRLVGNSIIVALVESEEDLPSFATWATVNARWQAKGEEKQQELCKLNIVDQHRWMNVPHLEYSRLDIPPNAMLELIVAPELPGKISLRRLWLTKAPMWSY